jgi:exodeoxyribonuclease-3
VQQTASREPIADIVVGIPGFTEDKAPGRRLLCRIGGRLIDNVYVPTRTAIGKVAFLDALREDYAERSQPSVLAGDFNIPGRPEDLAFRGLVDRGLVDCFRQRNADPGHFTWFPMTAWAMKRNYGMRLDYVFASRELAERIVDVAHDRETRAWPRPSDHLPVRARFDV